MRVRIFGKHTLCVVLLIVLLAAAPMVAAGGSIAIVDQSQEIGLGTFRNIVGYAPLGQEFTPSLPGLDAVELYLNGFMCELGPYLQVNIREGAITGPIIGQSSPFTPSQNYFSGAVHFAFANVVRLSPGKLFVMELVDISGKEFPCVESIIGSSGGRPDNPYIDGDAINWGMTLPGDDLWFREGLASAIPLTRDYCKNDLWHYLSRADGSAFKNQGDCIQFVNTGK